MSAHADVCPNGLTVFHVLGVGQCEPNAFAFYTSEEGESLMDFRARVISSLPRRWGVLRSVPAPTASEPTKPTTEPVPGAAAARPGAERRLCGLCGPVLLCHCERVL